MLPVQAPLIRAGARVDEALPSAGSQLTPFLLALPFLFLVFFLLRRQGASPSAGERRFEGFPWPGRRRLPHLPPRPLLPPSHHQQIHDEKYLSRILEADQQPPRE